MRSTEQLLPLLYCVQLGHETQHGRRPPLTHQTGPFAHPEARYFSGDAMISPSLA